MRMSKKRILVIGLDGVSWDILNILLNKGLLPTINKIKENGVYGTLKSTIPPVTAPAWVSFATGMNPANHGVFNFVLPRHSLSSLKPVTSKDIKGLTFYEVLEKHRLRCILINLPVTFPPRIKKGIVITSLMTPDESPVFPRTLLKEIPQLKEYRIVPDTSLLAKGKLKEYVEDIRRLEETRFKCAQELFKRQWNLFFILFSGTDWINHVLYDRLIQQKNDEATKDAIKLYQDIDRYIKWFTENQPPETNIIIMSDHGFKTCNGTFFINEWLRKRKYLKVQIKPERQRIYAHRFVKTLAETKKSVSLPTFFTRTLLLMTKILRLETAYKIYTKVRKYLPFIPEAKIIPDFKETLAYCISPESRAIYINTKTRFKDGIVADEKTYKNIRKLIINELKKLKDPQGIPLFEAIMTKEQVYTGRFLKDAPDILLIPNKCRIATHFAFVTFSENRIMNNDHDQEGIFLASGPDIKKGIKIKDVEIIDIAPTICHILGTSFPYKVDGKIIKEMLR